MTKEWPIVLFIGAAIACIGAGVVMFFATENSWWLWLVVPIVLFLS